MSVSKGVDLVGVTGDLIATSVPLGVVLGLLSPLSVRPVETKAHLDRSTSPAELGH